MWYALAKSLVSSPISGFLQYLACYVTCEHSAIDEVVICSGQPKEDFGLKHNLFHCYWPIVINTFSMLVANLISLSKTN